ncbi:MAG: hypothetical protein ACKOSS_05670 [Planctomycetia bacterium]
MRLPARLLLVLALGGLAGCGDPPQGAAPGAGSPGPASPASAPAPGPGPAALLERLLRAVATGPGLASKSLTDDAGFLRALLWPDLAAPGAEPAALAHMRATLVAGSLAAELAADPGARAALAQRDPFGLAMHDAWLAAAQRGLEGYRAWCSDEAPRLFRQRDEELQRLFERPLR